MGFEDEARLETVTQDGAQAIKYYANQCPVKLVNASVLNGSLLVEVSNDDFSSDIRRVTQIAAPAAGPSSFDEFRHYVLKNERVRLTTVGASTVAQLRTTIPGLALV